MFIFVVITTEMVKKHPKRSTKVSSKSVTRIARKVTKQELRKVEEIHYIDQAQASFSTTSAGQISSQLAVVTIGDTDTSRTGDKVSVKSIKVKGVLTTGDANQIIRVILFQWLQSTGVVVPIPSDILQNQGQPYSALSGYTKDQAGFTWIPLYDKLFNLNTAAQSNRTFSIKLSGKKLSKGKATPTIQFTSGTTNATGQYYLFFMSDSGAIPDPVFTYYSRVIFVG